MSDDRVRVAAENNARWCHAVCQAHGCPCKFIEDAWFNSGTPPPYYSNMVAMRGGSSVAGQQRLIRETLGANPGRSFAFKDSFSCIDPLACLDNATAERRRRFGLLFEASWIWLDPARFAPKSVHLHWARIGTDAELLDFERAWRNDQANHAAIGTPRQFPASLLADPAIAFLAGKDRDGRVKAVAIANRTDEVIGLSNVFGPGVRAAELWHGAVSATMRSFPSELPLVGYERDDDLKQAVALGFVTIGSLRVFVLNTAGN